LIEKRDAGKFPILQIHLCIQWVRLILFVNLHLLLLQEKEVFSKKVMKFILIIYLGFKFQSILLYFS